ncbi:PH domain-containing protein [Desulfovibrio inopinatus]|uniref:PH domain-containing protein n=1 Tax=Desulfovibrio inopinatus TaxID=102109 RepID=UPI0003FE77CD|nr:PH domain-containing protein [Desulfovibrio inopinatus]
MASLKRLLFGSETVEYKTGKHWAVFFKAIIFVIIAYYAIDSQSFLLAHLSFTPPEEFKDILPKVILWAVRVLCYGVGVVCIIWAFSLLLTFFTIRIALTGKRLIHNDILWGSMSVDLTKIESVRSEPGLLGGILGYGKVILNSSGGQRITMKNIIRPHLLEKAIFAVK